MRPMCPPREAPPVWNHCSKPTRSVATGYTSFMAETVSNGEHTRALTHEAST